MRFFIFLKRRDYLVLSEKLSCVFGAVEIPLLISTPPAPTFSHLCTTHSILVMDRGACTFASKALRANAAGASAAVIVQTHDVWPYVMEDSKGEAKAGGGLSIPVCMISKEKGEVRKMYANMEHLLAAWFDGFSVQIVSRAPPVAHFFVSVKRWKEA